MSQQPIPAPDVMEWLGATVVPTDPEAAALMLATVLHIDQRGKAGKPYLGHVRRVASRVREFTESPETISAAWLHDAVEDTDLTLDDLRWLGFSEFTVSVVDAVTRRDGENYYAFIERIRDHDAAIADVLARLTDDFEYDTILQHLEKAQ